MYWKPVRYDETNANAKDVIMFPDTTLLKVFRFEWMLLRTERPYVPQPEGTPMPDREKTADGKAKLFSIYLRPWVLERNDASKAVPLLTDLDIAPAALELQPLLKRRVAVKTMDPTLPSRSFARAWLWYVR